MSLAFGFALPHWQPLSGGFSPASLFAGGTAGAWYDPSDLTTLFTTSAGTTQCAMPGLGSAVSVGLMLDKSQGLVLGSELIANPDFTTDTWWLKDAGVTISGGTANWAATAATFQIYKTGILTVGALYKVTFTITSISSGGLRAVAGSGTSGSTRTTPGTYTEYLVAAGSGTVAIQSVGASTTASIDNVSYQVLSGNHAIAFNNTTARPELRARVNLLTYSEEFDNGAWTKSNVTVSANVAVAPDGTLTADKLAANTSATSWWVIQSITAIASVTGTVYAKASGWNFVSVGRGFVYGSGDYAIFDLQNGTVTRNPTFGGSTASITPVGNGWYRCQLLSSQSTGDYHVAPQGTGTAVNSGTPNSSDGVLVWGADLRPANIGANVPAYQRIADANTYDTSGFPLYLRFDGIDDSMYTPANLNLSGTDKVSVFAGVRKLSDVGAQAISELSSNVGSNNGSFATFANVDAAGNTTAGAYGGILKGTTAYIGADALSLNAPISNVVAQQMNIAAASDAVVFRIDGVQVDTSGGASAGTGNFGTYPLYIGSRGNSSLRFNGHLYSLAVVGSAVSGGNIAAMESWVAGKTGIAI